MRFRYDTQLTWFRRDEQGFADAPALETVMEAGQFLYIPSFWYHYIVSEGFNVQCNARSGMSMREVRTSAFRLVDHGGSGAEIWKGFSMLCCMRQSRSQRRNYRWGCGM